ncbi:MAG: AAA family ATPase [Methylophilaceae bacterium]
MSQILTPQQLSLNISTQHFKFANTAELVNVGSLNAQDLAWVAQSEAKNAAEFGLNIQQHGFNLLALGEPGCGRTTLMLNAMHKAAEKQRPPNDLVALYQFENNGRPLFLKLPAGFGTQLKQALDQFIRQLAKELTALIDAKIKQNTLVGIQACLTEQINLITQCIPVFEGQTQLQDHLKNLQQDLLDALETWQPSPNGESENLDALLSEVFLGRYRVNVLVEHCNPQYPPVIFDNDPSLQSLWGGIESTGESSGIADFMRLRAGHLLRADGGTLLLNLRDILADESNGAQILEKLHRFLRNGTLQIEDLTSGTNQGTSFVSAQAAIPVLVKLVMVATREDYYALIDEKQDFFNFFPIKIEFVEKIKASPENYQAYAAFIAQKCEQHQCLHFTNEAVASLLQAMHRIEEDQTRISTKFALLEKLMFESAAVATLRKVDLVGVEDVKTAINRKYARHSYIEAHTRASIVDDELMITVHGEAVGQINGLTHIDLADASFGSPVRISASCYAGRQGVITIDREVAMSGPTHDKGVMILQSWLHTNFAQFNPLNLSASLVFEQEYSGVDGDSASCAELFAILSALAEVPIKQGIAVTGALNQHGEVLPVGGINDKIEGYFRVCKDIGLDGQQGVLIPKRNMRHLMLSEEVIQAVNQGDFCIATMNHVAEGIEFLTGKSLSIINEIAESRLMAFKNTLEINQPMNSIINA